jgi:hypothetical protein
MIQPKRRQQHRILQCEIVLGVEVDTVKTGGLRIRSTAQALVPAAVKGEVTVSEPGKIGARPKSEAVFVIAHPAVEFGADQLEILG